MDFNLKNLCDFLVDLKTMMFSLFIGNVFPESVKFIF